MHRHGKIARLPLAVREELNRRILEQSHTCREMAAWLNSLPEGKAVCERVARARGAASSSIRMNDVSRWQRSGFLEWLRQRENAEETREMAKWSVQLAKASGENVSEQAAKVLSGQILELLEGIVKLQRKQKAENPHQLEEVARAVNSLAKSLASVRQADHNRLRLTQAQEKLAQADRKLSQADELIALDREKYQRDQSGMALKILGDQRAREIEASDESYEDKIEIMGKHLFGDLWKPRTEAEKRGDEE